MFVVTIIIIFVIMVIVVWVSAVSCRWHVNTGWIGSMLFVSTGLQPDIVFCKPPASHCVDSAAHIFRWRYWRTSPRHVQHSSTRWKRAGGWMAG